MIEVLLQVPQYKLFKAVGHPHKLPLSVTLSVTYNCNSRCMTCNIWKKRVTDLSLEELDAIFASLGETPYWFTISGGEPFLRNDLVEICHSIYSHCKPGIINIATNGLLCNRTADMTEKIVKLCPKTNIVVNLSVDGIGPEHDKIRGVPGNWGKTIETYAKLRQLKYPNFELGIHSVISKYNVEVIPKIYEYIMQELRPDSYITEVAEQRVEMDTTEADITPSVEEYSKAIDLVCTELKKQSFSRISRITQNFRLQYYDLAKRILREKRQVIPCYAGFASAQITPDGDVWACCIKATPMGNLRETDYDFKRVWFSQRANELRRSIRNKECYCPLANASYTNMLCHFPTLMKVGWAVLTQ